MNKIEWATVPSSLKSAKVFEPAIVNVAEEAHAAFQKLLYVFPPPINDLAVELVFVILIVDVFALRVRLVAVVIFHTLPVPVKVIVPEPSVSVRVLELLDSKLSTVKF